MANKTPPTFESLIDEYGRLWATLEIDKPRLREADDMAKKIIANRARYEAVELATGVPWRFIALCHLRESSLSFDHHLHNGDSLKARTWQVPKGRPKAPPKDGKRYTWEESAVDALTYENLSKVTEWPIERQAFHLEGFNGWGYRLYHADDGLSPYLWAGSNHHDETGKYVKDGKYDPKAPERQLGCMVILRRLYDQTGNTPPDSITQRPKTEDGKPPSFLGKIFSALS